MQLIGCTENSHILTETQKLSSPSEKEVEIKERNNHDKAKTIIQKSDTKEISKHAPALSVQPTKLKNEKTVSQRQKKTIKEKTIKAPKKIKTPSTSNVPQVSKNFSHPRDEKKQDSQRSELDKNITQFAKEFLSDAHQQNNNTKVALIEDLPLFKNGELSFLTEHDPSDDNVYDDGVSNLYSMIDEELDLDIEDDFEEDFEETTPLPEKILPSMQNLLSQDESLDNGEFFAYKDPKNTPARRKASSGQPFNDNYVIRKRPDEKVYVVENNANEKVYVVKKPPPNKRNAENLRELRAIEEKLFEDVKSLEDSEAKLFDDSHNLENTEKKFKNDSDELIKTEAKFSDTAKNLEAVSKDLAETAQQLAADQRAADRRGYTSSRGRRSRSDDPFNATLWAGAGYLFTASNLRGFIEQPLLNIEIGVSKSLWNVTPYTFLYGALIFGYGSSTQNPGTTKLGPLVHSWFYYTHEEIVVGYEQSLGTPHFSLYIEGGGAIQQNTFGIQETQTANVIDYIAAQTFGAAFNLGFNINMQPRGNVAYLVRLGGNLIIGPTQARTLNYNGQYLNANPFMFGPSISIAIRK